MPFSCVTLSRWRAGSSCVSSLVQQVAAHCQQLAHFRFRLQLIGGPLQLLSLRCAGMLVGQCLKLSLTLFQCCVIGDRIENLAVLAVRGE